MKLSNFRLFEVGIIFAGLLILGSKGTFMPVNDDEKEVNVPVNATHLRAIPGGKAEVASDVSAGSTSIRDVETLFREHHDRVFRAAYRITGSVMDAEDV